MVVASIVSSSRERRAASSPKLASSSSFTVSGFPPGRTPGDAAPAQLADWGRAAPGPGAAAAVPMAPAGDGTRHRFAVADLAGSPSRGTCVTSPLALNRRNGCTTTRGAAAEAGAST